MLRNRLAAMLCLLVATACSAAWAAPRPNVVVFLVDDLGVMDTSVPFLPDDEGNPRAYPLNRYYQTPNLERLANRGVRLTSFYAMSVCSPTRVSILTGQNPARHHTTTWILPESNNRGAHGPPGWNWRGLRRDSVTLPRILQSAGYRTIHIGKGHFGPRGSEGAEPRNLGFDVNVAGSAIGSPGSYRGELGYRRARANPQRDRAVPGLEEHHGTSTFLTDALTQAAKREVSATVDAGEPFFLYLSHYAVHAPHESDARFADRYAASGKPPRAQAYATLVEGVDRSLGEVLEHLEAIGVAEETLVFFLGDNGGDAPLGETHSHASAAPLRGKKGTHYEGGVRTPFVAAWAQPRPDHPLQRRLPIPAAAVQSQMANVCDLLPTICWLTSTEAPADHAVDGQSLRRLLTGAADPGHSQKFLMHFPHEHRSSYFTSLRDGDWKVVYHYYPSKASGNERYQLFNLADDPFESSNLAVRRSSVLKKMILAMRAELQRHGAQHVVDATDPSKHLKPELPSVGHAQHGPGDAG